MAEKRFRTRPVEVDAVQFKQGKSLKSEMMAFCPEANIGAPEGDDLDIRWFVVPGRAYERFEVCDGDWIVRGADGGFGRLTAVDFAEMYEPV